MRAADDVLEVFLEYLKGKRKDFDYHASHDGTRLTIFKPGQAINRGQLIHLIEDGQYGEFVKRLEECITEALKCNPPMPIDEDY